MKIRKLIPILLIAMMIVPVLLSLFPATDSVPAHIYPGLVYNTWIGNGSDPNATNAANWENGSIINTHVIVLGSISNENCSYDVPGQIKGFWISPSYTGVFKLIANITTGTAGVLIEGGTLEASDPAAVPIYTWTVAGPTFTIHDAVFRNLNFNLIFSNDCVYREYDPPGVDYATVLNNLTLDTGVTVTMLPGSGITLIGMGALHTYIKAGATLVLDASESVCQYPFVWYPGYNNGPYSWSWTNYGTVTAVYNSSSVNHLTFWAEVGVAADYDFNPGDIDSSIYFYNGLSYSIRCTLTGNTIFSNISLSIKMIFDCGLFNLSSPKLYIEYPSTSERAVFDTLNINADTILYSDIWVSGWLYYYNYSHIILNGYHIYMTTPGNVTYYYPPSFANSPAASVQTGLKYTYRPIMDQPVTFTVTNNSAGWLLWFNNSAIGIPQAGDIGIYTFGIRAVNTNGDVAYLNFTVEVYPNDSNIMLILSVLIGFGLIIFAAILEIKPLFMMSGIVWIYSGMTVFALFGTFFLVIGVGVGMLLFIYGGMSIGGSGDDKQA